MSDSHPRRCRRLALAVAGCVAASACGGTPEAEDPRPLRLALNWFPEAEHGGYYAADLAGAFRRQGVRVEILGGGPDAPVIQRVARGEVAFGLTNADGVITARAAGAPVVALFAPYQTNPRCIVVHEASGIRRIEEIADLTLALSQRPAFSHYLRHRFEFPGVSIVPYHGSLTAFLADEKYAVQGYIFSEPVLARRLGADPRALLVADTGFNPYASVLITTEEMIRRQPATVAAVVRASRQGWIAYLDAPQQANELIHQLNPEMDAEILAVGASMSRDLVFGPEVTTPGQIGHMSRRRWQVLLAQMIEAGILDTGRVDVDGCFTTRFLSPASLSAPDE